MFVFNRDFRYVHIYISYWRASEASETLSEVHKFELMRYVYIYINAIADFLSHRKCIAQK